MAGKQRVRILDMGVSRDAKAYRKVLRGRREQESRSLESARRIVDDVRVRGDAALFEYSKKFDKANVNARNVRIDPDELREIGKRAPAALKRAIREAAKRIRAYHRPQRPPTYSLDTREGRLDQIVRPLSRVGVYVPGGHTIYPSSVLMNVIPAQVAGVEEIVVATPPRETIAPALAFTLDLLKAREVYRAGGAQAVAALAFGTKSIPAVDKIVGPGRNVVAHAKRMVYGQVDIDMVAGASEVAILADGSADSDLIALDLLSQAEHGSGDELAVCITESARLAQRIQKAASAEIARSPARETFASLPEDCMLVCVTKSRVESVALVNDMAPEHLQIMTKRPRTDLRAVRNAGAVFLGPWTPVAMGDYFVGTNHVLPTAGAARFASGLGVADFMKRISVAEVSRSGLKKAASHVSNFARAENFVHHALSVERRVWPE